MIEGFNEEEPLISRGDPVRRRLYFHQRPRLHSWPPWFFRTFRKGPVSNRGSLDSSSTRSAMIYLRPAQRRWYHQSRSSLPDTVVVDPSAAFSIGKSGFPSVTASKVTRLLLSFLNGNLTRRLPIGKGIPLFNSSRTVGSAAMIVPPLAAISRIPSGIPNSEFSAILKITALN